MKTGAKRRRQKDKRFQIMPIIILLVVTAVLIGASQSFFEWERPVITLKNELSRLGNSAELTFSIEATKSGIRSFDVYFEQDGKRHDFYHKVFVYS